MTKSCLKVRCPQCKGRSRLTGEEFTLLRRLPTATVDHACEHCGTKFPASLAMHSPSDPQIHLPPTPAAAPAVAPTPLPPVAAPMPIPAAAPFAPRLETPGAAVPFGMLGERREEPGTRAKNEPAGSPPPFAAGASVNAPKEGKQSFNDWWKSQPPKKQWTMLACVAVTIGAGIFSMDSGEASAGPESNKEPDVVVTEPKKKSSKTKTVETKTTDSATEAVESVKATSLDDAMGLLCQETTNLGGKIEKPLAAAWAVEGKGFIVRGAKAFADLHNAGGSTSKWFVRTPTKRYAVKGVKFHPDFPADKLRELAAKGNQAEMLKLIQSAERADVAIIETTEAPAATFKLAKDPSEIATDKLEIASPVDPKAAKAGQSMVVKFAKQAMAATMMTDDGDGLKVALAAGVDAAVTTKDGSLVAFIPRKNAPNAVHPIIPAETLAGLLK